MPKFYIHETFVAEVTLVREIEAYDANEARLEFAAGKVVGAYIGDEIEGFGLDVYVLEHAKHNLPTPLFVPEVP